MQHKSEHVSNKHSPREKTQTATLYKMHQKTGITSSVSSREDGQVTSRCGCKGCARQTELSSRPCARYTVVQVHSIGSSSICSDPHETAICCRKHKQQRAEHDICTSATTQKFNSKTLQHEDMTTCYPPREDGHVANTCGCSISAPLTEPGSRPNVRCTVVQIHSIGRRST